MSENDLREQLSDVSHEIWSSWMRWMFTVGTFKADGTWVMPATLVERWRRQMYTPYAELSEREKDSDREQADKILTVMNVVSIPSMWTEGELPRGVLTTTDGEPMVIDLSAKE